jgi:DeoR family transcriptional regulator, fructose operon transcriptional repressor
MNVTKRRMEIFNLLQKNEVVELAELARRFNVSTMTVRRDLQMFERQGLLNMTYGSAYLKKEAIQEPSFAAKSNYLIEQKQYIGYAAAQFVQDGETIIVDCGTTPLQLLKYLSGKRVTVITNSWPVISYVSGNPKIKLILAPGEYYEVSAGAFGNLTAEFFGHLHADKVFMGANGFSIVDGVTEPDVETNAKKSIMAAGKKRFLLVDATKFDHTYLMQYAQLDDFDHVITDDSMDQTCRTKLEKVCKDVIYAGRYT